MPNPMAAYRIWCRTVEIDSGQYLVTIPAVPATMRMDAQSVTSESRIFASAALAKTESARMREAMKARVLKQGDEVTGMEEV